MAEVRTTIDLDTIRKKGIFLMVPAYGGQCFVSFAKSLANLSSLCTQYGIPFATQFIYNESLVQRARNYCVDAFLRSEFTYKDAMGKELNKPYELGIFIDADVEFNAQDVLILAQHAITGHDVVCGLYPKKDIPYEKLVAAVNAGVADEDPTVLKNYIGDFVFNLLPGTTHFNLGEPQEVMESGTGFMMFDREVLLKYKEAHPERSYRPDHIRFEGYDGSRDITAFFDCVIDPKSRRYLSEDYYFCSEIRKLGMKVWVLPWLHLVHHGTMAFGGNLGDIMSIGESATTDPAKLKKAK